MKTLKMALRNLRRNLRRSLITGIAIAFGMALLIFSSGFGDGAHGAMIEKGVASLAGHVVIQGEGWQEKRENDIVVPNSAAVAKQLRELMPAGKVVSRVYLQGLLTSPTGSVGAALTAVDPEAEKKVGDTHEKMVAGDYLDGTDTGLVLGKTLAETLGVDLGDKVVLMVQRDGEIESRLLRVQGLFSFGVDEIDGFTGQIMLPTAQELLGLGQDVTQISLHIDSYRDAEAATAQVRAAMAAPGLDILSWRQALPDLYMWIALDDAGLYVMIIIIALVVLLGIVNTVLMSVLERMKEFGVMLALGATPARLATLVMCEAALLGLIAVAAGLGLGLLGNWPLAVYGVNFADMMGGQVMEAGGVAMDMHFFADLSASKTLFFCALAYGMTLLAAIYPAVKAAKLKPIECLQHR